MIIWTMQPKAEFERQIRETGVCHEITYLDEQTEFPKAYDFLTEEMKKRVGPAPSGVRYPAWGYQMWEPKRPRPDIRWLRWNWGPSDMEHVRVELDVPDDQVLLLDDYAFPMRLNDWLISDSEAECDSLHKQYGQLSSEMQEQMKKENWWRVFDITPGGDPDWRGKGESIAACIWEIRKEWIRKIDTFYSRTRIADQVVDTAGNPEEYTRLISARMATSY